MIILRARPKVNLFLRILSLRSDKLHEIDTIYLPLDQPCDLLELSPGPPNSGLTLTCSDPTLENSDNILVKAYQAFSKATGQTSALHLHLTKNIPYGAGLGGGSSDAASLLKYLNENAGHSALSPKQLATLATALGADVPFFLQNGPARARGIGDQLTPVIPNVTNITLVLVCLPVMVSTAWAYSSFDKTTVQKISPWTSKFLTNSSLESKKIMLDSPLIMFNDLEHVVFSAFPEIRQAKEKLLMAGAAGVAMSGSGSSIFALFRHREQALKAAEDLMRTQTRIYIQNCNWGVAKR